MTERDRKYLEKETFKDAIGYLQYCVRRDYDETLMYNCGGVPLDLTLPLGLHEFGKSRVLLCPRELKKGI